MQTATIIIGLLVLVFGIYIYSLRARLKNTPLVADHEKIINLTDKNFQNQTKNKLVLIDFWAAWCAPCRMMDPILNEVAGELAGEAHIGKVNIEQYQSLARKYGVRNIPTMILLKNGIEVKRFVGVKNKDFLLQQIRAAEGR